MDRIAAGFQESQDLADAGFPQGTSFFRWYWTPDSRPVLAPRCERFQWAAKMKTGEADALCDSYPIDWAEKGHEWRDAPTAEEILLWKPSAALVSLRGLRHATTEERVAKAATLADALARAITGKGGEV